MNLRDLESFVLVAQNGTLTAAAEHLGVPKSTVSRRIRRLEAEVGVPLLLRSANRVRLTEYGDLLRRRCGPALREIKDAERELEGYGSEPSGLLRVTVLETLGNAPPLTKILLEFQDAYPKIELEILATDRILDLLQDRIDVAIRPMSVTLAANEPFLFRRRLGDLTAGFYATPKFIEENGYPETLEEVQSHLKVVHILLTRKETMIHTPQGKLRSIEVHPRFTTTSFGQVLEATMLSRTVGLLPAFKACTWVCSGHLVPLLPGWRMESGGVGLVCLAGHQVMPKVRAFFEFMSERAVPSGLITHSGVCPEKHQQHH